jgi:ribosomal protein S6--L-glutamate ligase
VRIGVAGIPGAWSTERLASALRGEGANTVVFAMDEVSHDIGRGQVRRGDEELGELDAVVVKKIGDQLDPTRRLSLHALRTLERLGVRVFSPAESIERAMDRYRMTVILAEEGIPIPSTIAAPSALAMHRSIDAFGEAGVKPVYTSKGRGMVRIHAGQRLPPHMSQHPILVQRYVRSPGRDIGATVVGGRFVGAFYRVAAPGEWLTTTAQGGSYAPCRLPREGVGLAERCARLFGLDYTVVDLVEAAEGLLVYEVSAFGGFRGLLEGCAIDGASLYAGHIMRELRERVA